MRYINEAKTVSYIFTSVATLIALSILWGCGDSGEMMSLPTVDTADQSAPSMRAELRSETIILAAPFQEPNNPTSVYLEDEDNVINLDMEPNLELQPYPDFAFRCDGPDPAAVEIDVVITQLLTQTCGDIRITGIVKNIGTTAFRADPQDATCMLLENGRMVDSEPIENLAPGETIRLSYERDWCTTTEIPMDYELKIHYGPDTPIDGNPDNDDCHLANNRRQRSGESINDLFP